MTQPDLPLLAYPLFAPLPIPMIHHLLRGPSKPHPAATPQPLSWQELEATIRTARHAAYLVMHPYVAGEGLTTAWLMNALTMNSPGKTPVQNQTLALWHSPERGLLRYQERGRPAVDNAAALLITRMADKRERNWLPSSMAEEEADWWCWRQDGVDAPVVTCPVPLPADLPPDALLWTPWAGASWQNRHWLKLGELGAIRWGGTREIIRGGRWVWTLSQRDLAHWDPEVAALTFSIPPPRNSLSARELTQETTHQLAQLALFRLALSPARLGMFAHSSTDLTALGLSSELSSQLPDAGAGFSPQADK